jgi:hypothetical protein
LPQKNTVRIVDFKNIDRGSADGSSTNQVGSVPNEVAFPLMPARVVERRYLFGEQIETRDVGSFVIVAWKTGEPEVPRRGWTVVLSRDDVVDLVLKAIEFLRDLTILTAKSRASPNQFFKIAIHYLVRFFAPLACEALFRRCRALDFHRASTFPARS